MGRRYGADHETLGAKVGPKIGLVVAQVMTDHLRKSAGHRAQIGADAAIKFFRTITDERDTHGADLLALLLGHEATRPELEKVLRFAHGGSGELSALLSTHMVSGAIAGGIGSGISNLLAPANQAIMFADPANILEPQTMSQLAAARIVSPEYAAHISQMSGLPAEASALLLEGAYNWPSLELALTMLRRGEIDGQEAVEAMRRAAIPEQFIGPMLELRNQLLSPEDLALMVLKGITDEATAAKMAAQSGVPAQHFSDLVKMSGEPPGLEQLQEYLRREFIDDERFAHGVKESRVKDEWVDVLLKARFQRASPSDALRGVVQGHLSDAEGKKIAEQNGLAPEDWRWLAETEGNPAAPMELIELWRRGEATEAQVRQGIREGRTKNKYIPALLHLKRALPSLFQITKMVQSGSIDDKEATRLLHEQGYETDVASAIVHSSHHEAVTKDKQLAKAEVLELLYDHAITEARAETLLKALGYSAANAHLLILLVNLKREKALRQAAMSPVRSAYLARHITEAEASTQLDQLGVPHEQRDFALAMWKIDRASHTKLLTEAQIVKANEKGLLSDGEAETRLTNLGYHLADAKLLLDLEKDRTTPA